MKSEKKRFKRPKSLNIMLWRNFSLFSLLIILLVGIVCYIVVQSSYSTYVQNKMRSVGSGLSTILSGKDESDGGSLSEYINEQAFSSGLNIIVMTESNEILLPQNISSAEEDYWSGILETIQSKISDSGNNEVVFKYSDAYIYVVKTDYAAAQEAAYIVIGYSLDIANSAIGSVQRYLIIVGLFIILAAFIVSYGIAQKISDPLKRLTITANKMAKGDYNVKFASTEYQEIAQLSDTLNYAKDEIKKTDDFQKELLANVSHDLKTPLTMIKAYASMIQEISGDDPEKRNQHLQVIIDESDRLTGLVNDLLNVSKIRSDVDQINKKVFNLTEFLFGIMRKFNYLQETQGYSFYVDIDADLYTYADEEKIGQVLYNLISNAVNYTGADKKVFVSLKLDMPENRIKFSVRDTGKGIKKEDIPSIWNRYYRVKEEHARSVKGTGLGLSIVKTILEKHAFNFGVESEEGNGSTFWVDFPDVDAQIPPDEN